MDIEFYGGNCFKIKTKKATIVVDDNLKSAGGKMVTKKDSVLLQTSSLTKNAEAEKIARLVLNRPGEFEVGDISIVGVQVRGHMDGDDERRAVAYQFVYGNATVTVLGHVHPDVSDELVELAGGTDILIVPVGGNGYTLDAIGATSVIKKIDPDMIIPAHYETEGLHFEVPAAPLEEFLKTSGLNIESEEDIIELGKTYGELKDSTTLIKLRVK